MDNPFPLWEKIKMRGEKSLLPYFYPPVTLPSSAGEGLLRFATVTNKTKE